MKEIWLCELHNKLWILKSSALPYHCAEIARFRCQYSLLLSKHLFCHLVTNGKCSNLGLQYFHDYNDTNCVSETVVAKVSIFHSYQVSYTLLLSLIHPALGVRVERFSRTMHLKF